MHDPILTAYQSDVRQVYIEMNLDERFEESRRYREDRNLASRDRLVHSGLLWVIKLAKIYARKFDLYEQFLDQIQEGNMGLLRAVELYNPELGYSFTTYSTHWIKQKMLRYIANHAETIRQPVYRKAMIAKLKKMSDALEKKLERKPTNEELLANGLEPNILNNLSKNRIAWIFSLDDRVAQDRDQTWAEVIPAPQNGLPFELNNDPKLIQKTVEFIRAKFSHRDAEVFVMRYGLDDSEPKSLEEVGLAFGRTRERIRQIIDKILASPLLAWYVKSLLGETTTVQVSAQNVYTFAGKSELSDIQLERMGEIVSVTEKVFELGPNTITSRTNKAKRVQQARKLAIFLACESMRWIPYDVAKYFGLTPASVEKSVNKARRLLDIDTDFKSRFTQAFELLQPVAA